jgi:hypothetical protein
MSTRRNPYIVLGVDFGAPVIEAKKAFALVSRRIRRHPDPPFTIEDVTAAEREVQDLVDPPRSIGIFRVPADPGAYEPDGTGDLLSLAPRNLPRQGGGGGQDAAQELATRLQAVKAQALSEAARPGLDTLADQLRSVLGGAPPPPPGSMPSSESSSPLLASCTDQSV